MELEGFAVHLTLKLIATCYFYCCFKVSVLYLSAGRSAGKKGLENLTAPRSACPGSFRISRPYAHFREEELFRLCLEAHTVEFFSMITGEVSFPGKQEKMNNAGCGIQDSPQRRQSLTKHAVPPCGTECTRQNKMPVDRQPLKISINSQGNRRQYHHFFRQTQALDAGGG